MASGSCRVFRSVDVNRIAQAIGSTAWLWMLFALGVGAASGLAIGLDRLGANDATSFTLPLSLLVAVFGVYVLGVRTVSGWVQRLSPRHAARSVFNLNRALDLVIVYPPRREEPGSILPRVAGEDFMAMIHVLGLANAAGFPPARVRMTPVDAAASTLQDDPFANLILISCPRSNAVTGKVLEKVRTQYGLDIDFVPEAQRPRQHIRFVGVTMHSNAWEAEKELRDLDVQPWRGTMKDWGLIVKCRNPYNETAKVFIIAGIRGIGTWGAACHLADHLRSLYNQFKEGDFAAVVEVEYANFRIIGTRLDKWLPLSYPPTSPPPIR